MRLLRLFLVPCILVMISGCFGGGGGGGVTIATPPPLDQATRVAVAPFIAGQKTGNLGKWVPINLANRFELTLKDTEWIYDQSEKVNPVGAKLKELGLTLTDIFNDPALAAKVGQALNADLIIIGQIDNPRFREQNYNQPVKRVGHQAGISGSTTYVRTRQSATIQSRIKVVDTKTGELVFNDSIGDYIKYWFAYQTQQRDQVIFKTTDEMLADLGKHLPRRIAYALYPTGMPMVQEGEVLLKPDIELLGSAGEITFD